MADGLIIGVHALAHRHMRWHVKVCKLCYLSVPHEISGQKRDSECGPKKEAEVGRLSSSVTERRYAQGGRDWLRREGSVRHAMTPMLSVMGCPAAHGLQNPRAGKCRLAVCPASAPPRCVSKKNEKPKFGLCQRDHTWLGLLQQKACPDASHQKICL